MSGPIYFKDGYKYQLVKDAVFEDTNIKPEEEIDTEFIKLTPEGQLTIHRLYCWDGASGPTVDTGVTGLLANSMRASLAHDALYQLMRMELLGPKWRTDADILLDTLLEEDGMWAFRRWYWLRGVQWFAGGAVDPDNAKEVYEAP